jgi:exodeoxyribonuclease VII small subunit
MTQPKKEKTASQESDFDFEQAIEELENLVSMMEDGELSLENSLKSFEEGIKLTRKCQTELNNAEKRVQVLINEKGDSEELDPST